MFPSCMPVNMGTGLASSPPPLQSLAERTSHLPKVSGQHLIRALLLSKTVYTETVYDSFNIYVVLVFFYPIDRKSVV